MAVLYKFIQDNRATSSTNGMWYARAIMNGTVDTNALAEIMQRNCTVKKSDIKAVLTELVETMQDQLQNSMRVKIDGLGSFKIGLKGTYAESPEEYDVSKNIVGMRVNFLPETHINLDKTRSHALLDGATVRETAKNNV